MWSGGGGGDFIKHDLNTLEAVTSGHYAEDNILFDGNFWTQYFATVYYLTPEMRIVASATSPVARPTGFFLLGGTAYFSDSSAAVKPLTTSHFYTMQVSGSKVVFTTVNSIPFHLASPKTPLFYNGYLYMATGAESPTTYLLILDAALNLVAYYEIAGTQGASAGEATPTQIPLNGNIYFLSDSTIAATSPLHSTRAEHLVK